MMISHLIGRTFTNRNRFFRLWRGHILLSEEVVTKRSLRLRAVGLGIAIFLASFPIGFDGELRDNVEAQQSWSLKMVAPLEVGIVCVNIDKELDFYTNVLGLKLVADSQTRNECKAWSYSRGL